MKKIIDGITGKIQHSLVSIKNRYPCRITKVSNCFNQSKKISVRFHAVSKLHVRDVEIDSLLNDQELIEKFHPTDGVKLGFLSAVEILKTQTSIEDAEKLFQKITQQMFDNIVLE